jgi:phytoene desaturase
MLHHNFYLSGRYRENFEAIFRDHTLPDDPSLLRSRPLAHGAEPGAGGDGESLRARPRAASGR